MKDNELRELLANIERKIEAATATIVGGNLKEMVERIHDNQDSIERIHKSLDRIQELTERPASEGRKLFDAAIRETEEKLRREQLEQIKVIPSPSVPAIVGMSVGAIIFLVGMFVAWVLLR